MKKVWYIGGDSGGHIYPLLTLQKNHLVLYNESNFIFWTNQNPFINSIINKNKNNTLIHNTLFYPKPQKNYKIIFYLFFTGINFFKILYFFLKERPDEIYSTGGYFSVLFLFLAKLLRVNFFLYHLDVIPGFAARLMSYCNPIQFVLYEKTKMYLKYKDKIRIREYPVRYTLSDRIDQQLAKKKLNCFDKKVIFILGGSQGSLELNDLMKKVISYITVNNFFIIHQTGLADKEELRKIYVKAGISFFLFDFQDNLNEYYSAADLTISRAGAGAIAEIVFFDKKALLVPLKKVANNHQEENAQQASIKHSQIVLFSSIEEMVAMIQDL